MQTPRRFIQNKVIARSLNNAIKNSALLTHQILPAQKLVQMQSNSFIVPSKRQFSNLQSENLAGSASEELLNQTQSSQAMAEMKAESGFDNLRTENQSEGENKFKETLEKYYTDIQITDSEETTNEAEALHFFESKSSSYYKESQINFDRKISQHNKTMSETLSDIQRQFSDIRFSDGFNGGRGRFSSLEDTRNHKYNTNENYGSGYETTMDMPKGQVLQAMSIPILVASMCGAFIIQNTQNNKNKQAKKWL